MRLPRSTSVIKMSLLFFSAMVGSNKLAGLTSVLIVNLICRTSSCSVSSELSDEYLSCVKNGVEIMKTGSDGSVIALTRICSALPSMEGADSILYHSFSCCLGDALTCHEMALMSSWSHSLWRFPKRGKVFSVDEFEAMRQIRGDRRIAQLHFKVDNSVQFVSPITGIFVESPAQSMVIEYVAGETLLSFLVGKELWGAYFQAPSEIRADKITAKVNCIMKKALLLVDAFAGLGLTHGDLHSNNVMTINSAVECADVKAFDLGRTVKFSLAESIDDIKRLFATVDAVFMHMHLRSLGDTTPSSIDKKSKLGSFLFDYDKLGKIYVNLAPSIEIRAGLPLRT